MMPYQNKQEMKKYFLTVILLVVTLPIFAQRYIGYERWGKYTDAQMNAIDTSNPNEVYRVFNTTQGKWKCHLGSGWVDCDSAGTGTDDQQITDISLTGNVLSITIENGNTVTQDLSSIVGNVTITDFSLSGNIVTLTLSNGSTDTVDLSSIVGVGSQNLSQVLAQGNDAGGSKISNLGNPTLGQDAVTQAYLMNLLADYVKIDPASEYNEIFLSLFSTQANQDAAALQPNGISFNEEGSGTGGGASDAIDLTVTPSGNFESENAQAGFLELQGDIDALNNTPSFTTLTTYANIAALPAVTGSEADVYCIVTDDASGDNGLYGIVGGAWEFLFHKHNPLAPFNRTSSNVIDEDDPNYQSGFDIDATGAIVADAAKYTSGYIPVLPGDRFYGQNDFNRYALYDKDSVLISVANPPYAGGTNHGVGTDLKLNITPSNYFDDGVRYVRFDGDLTDVGSIEEIVRAYDHTSGGKSSAWTDFDAGYTRDNTNYIYEAEGVIIPKLTTNLYDYKRGNYTGGYLSGGTASTSLPSTGFIPVQPGYEYHHNYGSNINIAFFTSDFTYVSGTSGQSASAPSTARYVTMLIPSYNPTVNFDAFTVTQGKRQVQISDVRSSTLENIFVEPVKVCLIGDSIGTEGESYATYAAYGGTMADLLKYENYINVSVSGGSLRDYADKTVGFSGLTTPLADLYIVTLGTNDFGYNRTIGDIADVHPTDDTTFGDLDGIVTDILSVNANAKIAFITPLPRATQDTENVVNNTLWDYNNAIIEFARENGYPVLDLLSLSQFQPWINTISTTWTENSSGTPGDGLHPIDASQNIYIYPYVAAFIKTNMERAK